MSRVANKNGFTLIELMLSMAFLSMLLVVIMLTIMQITRIYDKGVSMREVNQAGRAISLDLTRTISSATPFDLGSQDRFRQTTGAGGAPTGGRLCTGQVSYIWNIGSSTVNGESVRLAKVNDPTANYCVTGASVESDPGKIDLLDGGERDLVVHNFTIQEFSGGATSTGQALYAVRFIIGVKDTTLLESNNAACKPPIDSNGGDDYCAVNRFDLVVRAGNKELLSEE